MMLVEVFASIINEGLINFGNTTNEQWPVVLLIWACEIALWSFLWYLAKWSLDLMTLKSWLTVLFQPYTLFNR